MQGYLKVMKYLWVLPLGFILLSTTSHATRIVGGCASPAPPANQGYEVPVGEKLKYKISFLGMKRGHVFFVTSATSSNFWVKVKARLRLDGFFHWLDDIDGRMVSYVRPSDARPGRMFNHVSSGKYDEIRESAIFSGKNEVKGTLLYKGRKRPAKLAGTSDVLDALSVMYYLRSRQFVAGAPFCFEVYHRRRLWRIDGQMQQKVSLSNGDALQIVASFRRLGGGKADATPKTLTAWLSADRQQLPLKLTSPMGFGDLNVDLVNYRLLKASR